EWGLATHCIPESAHDLLLGEMAKQTPQTFPALLNRYSVQAPRRLPAKVPAGLSHALTAPDEVTLWNEAAKLLAQDELPSEWRECLQTLLSGSPISACVVARQLALGGRLSRGQAFEWEYHASLACLRLGDFYEGVRTRLVEKGGTPAWKFRHPREVPPSLTQELTRIPS
ncbi:MAG: hypothetical protein EBT03_13450, partial [Betaproteobacteria bacterium]|nr:hypothetical protein [Betaproteobacteria bacterium]